MDSQWVESGSASPRKMKRDQGAAGGFEEKKLESSREDLG